MVNFNKQQKEAINFYKGACGVIAGAGSGKSTVLVNRIKNLIDEYNVNEQDILAISFTKNTANDLNKKLNRMGYKNVNIGTFHSICGRILTKEGYELNLVKEWEVKNCFQRIDRKVDIKEVMSFISYQKNYLKSYDDNFVPKESKYDETELRRFFKEYEDLKHRTNTYDFDDYLIECYKLLQKVPNTHTYNFLLVDEHQDSNLVQNLLIKQLCPSGNIFCVFDYRQCLPIGTKIRTENGFKNIENITNEDTVIVGSGRGEVSSQKVTEVMKKQYQGKLIELKTQSGQTIKATPNHTIFLNTLIKNKHFIYLMYKEGIGYRIGRSSIIKTSKKGKVIERNGYEKRLTDEGGDKVWLIKVCDSLEEASFYENYYAFEYGIPLYVFNLKQRRIILNQEYIDKLFKSIETIPRGEKLLSDLSMSFDFPHYIPQGNSGSRSDVHRSRMKLNFVMFGSSRKGTKSRNGYYNGHKHELSFSTIDEQYADKAKKYFESGVSRQVNGQGFEYFVGRKVTNNQDELMEICYNILDNIDHVELECKSVLCDSNIKYKYMPICNARVGMGVPIFKDGKVIEDKITEVNTLDYNGYVFDLNIDFYRNYVANDILVHNCIYSFRGSNPDYAMNFEKEWDNATIINLDTNYRSKSNIVNHANHFIKHYYGDYKHYSDSVANDESDGKITLNTYIDGQEEGVGVVDQIERLMNEKEDLNDIAVLYRANSQVAHVENELKRRDIDYVIADNSSFFKRTEIAGIIAYLRLILNPHDDDAFSYIISRFRNYPLAYFSKKVIENIEAYAGEHDLSYYEALTQIKYDKPWQRNNAEEFEDKIYKLILQKEKEVSLYTLIDNVIKTFNIKKYIREKYTNLEEVTERLEALETLKAFIKNNNLESFISYVYSSNSNKKRKKQNGVKLMSIHASKGLEFKHVFLIGIENGKFPHVKSDLLDEARLMYVAVTRPKENLYISQIGADNLFTKQYIN